MEKSQLTLLTCKDFYHTPLGCISAIVLKSNPNRHSYWDLSSFFIILLSSDDEVHLVVDMDFALPWHLNPSLLNLNEQYIIHFLSVSMLASQVDPADTHGGWCDVKIQWKCFNNWSFSFFLLILPPVLNLCNDSFMWDFLPKTKHLFFPIYLEIATVSISYQHMRSKLHQVNQGSAIGPCYPQEPAPGFMVLSEWVHSKAVWHVWFMSEREHVCRDLNLCDLRHGGCKDKIWGLVSWLYGGYEMFGRGGYWPNWGETLKQWMEKQ